MNDGGHLRELKNMTIIMALENIPYDILIILGRQRFSDTVVLNTSPEKGMHIVQDYG